MAVVDASALVAFLADLEHAPWVQANLGRQLVHAPHVVDLEVTSGLRGLVARKAMPASHGRAALSDLAAVRLRRYPHRLLLDRVWELRSIASVYDAAYIALAELLDEPLVTLDLRLARSHGHRARILAP